MLPASSTLVLDGSTVHAVGETFNGLRAVGYVCAGFARSALRAAGYRRDMRAVGAEVWRCALDC